MAGLADLVVQGIVAERVGLAALTTYKMGGPARWFADVRDLDALRRVVDALTETSPGEVLPVVVLGRGSNMLIADGGFPGLVLRLSGDFTAIEIEANGDVVAGGAAPLGKVARTAAAADRGGLEFFVGVPGSVGGAVRMNAGCHGSETADWLDSALVVDLRSGDERRVNPTDLDMRYRHSTLADDELVVTATFRTVARPHAESERLMREVTSWRKEHQPGGTLNAGSVFKNPEGDSAGRIIDSLGLKGLRVGGASVSTKHANFFVSEAGTSASDVFDLVREVQRRVADETGITLTPEIRFVGDFETRDVAGNGGAANGGLR